MGDKTKKLYNLPKLTPRDKILNRLIKERENIKYLVCGIIYKDEEIGWTLGSDGMVEDKDCYRMVGVLEEVKFSMLRSLNENAKDYIE